MSEIDISRPEFEGGIELVGWGSVEGGGEYWAYGCDTMSVQHAAENYLFKNGYQKSGFSSDVEFYIKPLAWQKVVYLRAGGTGSETSYTAYVKGRLNKD